MTPPMTPPTIEPVERKHTLHQAGCVSVGGRGILIEGLPGSGKSSLALMLLDRGAQLVGDDGVTLEVRNGRLWAFPPPYIAGKLEIRNVGIVDLPPPAELAASDDLPGSLFLLLENSPRAGVVSYGELALCGDELAFAGERLADLPQLIAACLKLPALP